MPTNGTTTRSTLEGVLLSLLRVVVGFLFWAHGAQKLYGWLGGTPVPDWQSQIGLAGILEFYGGALFALGFMTRFVAFILSGLMAWAYFQAHSPQGFWPIENKGELAALYSFVFLYFVGAGAGPISLDALFRRKRKVEGT